MDKNKYGNITKTELANELNNNAGNGKTEVLEDENKIIVKFIDSNRFYEVDSNGNISKIDVVVDNNPGNIEIGINGEKLKGTEESPYEIWCIEDLVEWSQNYSKYQNAYIQLCRTLNFNSNLSYTNGKILNCNTIDELKDLLTDTTGSGFTPIENFSGSFNGQEYEIKNIFENKEGNAGLFSTTTNSIVKNLTISGEIAGTIDVGGLIGYAENSIVESCGNNANIKNNSSAGHTAGIIGCAVRKN